MKNIRIQSILIILTITLAITSCNQKVKTTNQSTFTTKNNNSDKELSDIKALAESLELTEAQYQDLKAELEGEVSKNRLYYRKIHLLQASLDSIKTQSNALKEVIARYETVDAPSLSNHEQEIALLVHHMHASWKKMPIINDKDEILQYFLPKFIVNQVSISGESKGKVAGYTHEDYDNYLKEIINRKGYSYEFGDVQFLDIIVKNESIFNVVYKCVIRTYKEDMQLHASSFVVTLTGKKQDELWKVANYSIVSFQYQTLMNTVL